MKNSSARVENPAPLKVLVVDDEPLIRWSLSETLVHEGCDVLEAGTAKEAMLTLTREAASPDVILLDFRLPDSDDLTLLENIRRTAPSSAVVMMTAYGTPEVIAAAITLGAYRVVSKPIELRDLIDLVRAAYTDRRP